MNTNKMELSMDELEMVNGGKSLYNIAWGAWIGDTSGAVIGAMIGSDVPVVGTVIGGVAGAVIGGTVVPASQPSSILWKTDRHGFGSPHPQPDLPCRRSAPVSSPASLGSFLYFHSTGISSSPQHSVAKT